MYIFLYILRDVLYALGVKHLVNGRVEPLPGFLGPIYKALPFLQYGNELLPDLAALLYERVKL